MNRYGRIALDLTMWSLSLLVLAALARGARADEGGRMPVSLPDNPRYKAECGSCHVAYPPQLLPAETWRRLMSGLDRHFGTDASIDPKAVVEIGALLAQQSANGRRATESTTNLRITGTAWFRRKHDEIAPAVWQRASIRSASNCAACHTAADQGDYRERNVRIPR